MSFLYLSTLLNLFPIAIANFCPTIFTNTNQTIMANIQKERDLVRPHLWALLQYNNRSTQRPSINAVWRAGTEIHLHHTAASHCITLRRQREWYQKVVENVPACGRGETCMHEKYLNMREVWKVRVKLEMGIPYFFPHQGDVPPHRTPPQTPFGFATATFKSHYKAETEMNKEHENPPPLQRFDVWKMLTREKDYPVRAWNRACMCAYECPPLPQRTDELHWPDWDQASERQPLLKFSWQTEIDTECNGDEVGWVGVCRKAAYIHVTHARLPFVCQTRKPHFPSPLRKWHEEHAYNFCSRWTKTAAGCKSLGCETSRLHSLAHCSAIRLSIINRPILPSSWTVHWVASKMAYMQKSC